MTILNILGLLAVVAVANAADPYSLPHDFQSVLRGAKNLVENFDCDNKPYGYYADVDNDCQIFHICLPITDDEGKLVHTNRFSFFCGNGTLFSQDILTCVDEAEALPCQEAPSLFESINSQFGSHTNFSGVAPDGSTFLDRVRGAVHDLTQAPVGSDNQNSGADARFSDFQAAPIAEHNQEPSNGNVDFSGPNSGTTNVLGNSRGNQGGFSGFSDSNAENQFS